jgi:acyl carrier protein
VENVINGGVMNHVAAAVREIVASHAATNAFDDATQLGSGGVGLDSIAIAEVLIACEERFGVEIADLLGGDPVTIARIVERIGRA